jgi:putative SOS response-associated peptidase YedK
MCGRYALTKTELLEEFFEFSFTGNQILPRFNVAPTTQIPVIRLREDGQRELIDVRWGLVPFWSKPGDQLPLLINARAETLSSKPAFRDAFQRRRCIVPASGYYEWQKLPGGAKQPFYITRRDGLPIAFAGLWENAKELHGTAAIVTTAASEETQQIHDRMPVILEKPDFPRWLASQPLTNQEAESLLRPSPAGSLVARQVSSRVNNVRNDDAGLIDEILSSPDLIAGINRMPGSR